MKQRYKKSHTKNIYLYTYTLETGQIRSGKSQGKSPAGNSRWGEGEKKRENILDGRDFIR